MKLFIILNFFLIVKLVSGNELIPSIFKSVENELQRQNLQLIAENGQLHMAIAELRIENANLKLDLLQTREKEKILSEESELIYLNCSALFNDTNVISENLEMLSKIVNSFNSHIYDKITEYEKKLGKTGLVLKKCAALPHDEEGLFHVACDAMSSNGTWTVIQRRINGETNFYRPWAEYRTGFGNVTGEFFVGLENLYLVTKSRAYELLIEMEDFENEKRHAKYDLFEIDSEDDKYALKELGTYSGDAGDSLSYHKSQKFTTYDQDNDQHSINCAERYKGAWWHNHCHQSNLNGEYNNRYFSEGIIWETFHGNFYSLKYVEIKIRPKV